MQTQQPATASADAGTVSLDYQTCRNRREAAEAELAELELAERQGQLIRVDGVTALINRSKNLVLTQAQLNRPEGVRFAQGAINAYRSILRDAGQLLARRDAKLPSGYLPFTDFQAAWASLPDNIEHMTVAEVQDFLHTHGVEIATDTVTNGNINGVVKLKDDVVTAIDQHDEHDAAPADVGNGAGCHAESVGVESQILAEGNAA